MPQNKQERYKEFVSEIFDSSVVFFTDSELTRNGEYLSNKHQHNFNEVIYVQKGSLSIICEDECITLYADDTAIIPRSVRHSLKTDSVTYYTIISFWSKDESSIIKEITSDGRVILYKNFPAAGAFQRILSYYYGNYKYKKELISACLHEICAMMVEYSAAKEGDESDNITLESNNYRSYIIEQYFQSNFLKEASLKDLAEHLHLSQRQTSRLIIKMYGESFTQRIKILRINLAKQKLSETERSVEEIAKELGYKHTGGFFSAFKEILGITPLEYRKKMRRSS